MNIDEELKPVKCGCGGEASCYFTHYWGKCFTVQCSECGIETKPCDTEAEAITAWNTAMGATDIRVGDKERTAKVKKISKNLSEVGHCE